MRPLAVSRIGQTIVLVTALVGAAAGLARAAPAAVIETDHMRAEIVVANTATAPGETVRVAIRHALAPGWHTYWINPGDSGEAAVVEWSLPSGGEAAPLSFPVPSRLPYPPLMNHGYTGAFALLGAVTVPADWPAGTPYPVGVEMDWLVCSDICIPEGGAGRFAVATAEQSVPDPAVGFTFMKADWALPREMEGRATYRRGEGTIELSVPVAAEKGAHFFAYDRDAIDHVPPHEVRPGANGTGAVVTMPAGSGRLDGTLEGVLKTSEGGFHLVARGAADPPATAPPGAAPPATAAPTPPAPAVTPPLHERTLSGAGLARAFVFAFLGGVLLNLMPCVFPVLALKALGLVEHADARTARRIGIAGAYAAGILVTMMGLAAVLFALRSAGQAVGWGFQLQSPVFLATMALLFFAAGLNLSGVFQVGAGLTRLGGLGPRQGLAGSFATGMLAVVVATPCTAPLMAVALAAALAAPPAAGLAVFVALGLGLAAPFALVSLAPGVTRVLPRPGVWMERLKQALAFPLFATVAWLVWVLAQVAGLDALLPVLLALVLVALAAWLLGLAQRGTGRAHRVVLGLAAASFAAAILVLWPAANGALPAPVTAATPPSRPLAAGYTSARLAALRQQGIPVFVNVTAAWCITCKVNEAMVFARPEFATLLEQSGTAFLEADWTRRDPDVTHLIERFERAGVPLYVYFPATGEPQVLPQFITLASLRAAFAKG